MQAVTVSSVCCLASRVGSRRRRRTAGRGAFALIELLVVIAIIALLVGVLLPSINQAKDLAELAVCGTSLSANHDALLLYAADHGRMLPPFAFSDPANPDLALSGHFGGKEPGHAFGLKGMDYINLVAAVQEECVSRDALLCPGTPVDVQDGTASWFADTDRFSSYCLRFPPSKDLYVRVGGPPAGKSLLWVYRVWSGGQRWPYGSSAQGPGLASRVPRVCLFRSYRTEWGVFDPARGALLADAFWYRAHQQDGDPPVQRGLCHGDRYNVAFGDGSVQAIQDDGTVAGLAVAPGQTLGFSDDAHAQRAESIWQYFEASVDR